MLRINNSPELTQDLVQDIFIKVWINRESLTDVDNFSAWLYRVTHNHAVSGIRRMALETTILGNLRREAQENGYSTDENLLQKQLQEKLQQAISKLPPQQKLIYTLSRMEGLKNEEIATQLNLSVSTIKNHMTAAIRNLKLNLGRDYNIVMLYCFILFNLMD